jgi:cytochrome c-type biogenesis protein CcmH
VKVEYNGVEHNGVEYNGNKALALGTTLVVLVLALALTMPLGKTPLSTTGAMHVASAVQAQTPTPAPRVVTDDEVNVVARQLYCPVCENIPLDVCPTQACAEWRELIREKLGEGWTAEQIKTFFADRYGDRVLGAPPARGFNWLTYIVPPLVILAGAFLLYRAFRAWRVEEPPQAGVHPAELTEVAPVEAGLAGKEHLTGGVDGAGHNAVEYNDNDKYIRRLEKELKKRR